jgi:hypothetical protein
VESCNYKKRLDIIDGAEGGTRTPMGLLPLDPEPSVSANSTTSALAKDRKGCYMGKTLLIDIPDKRFCQW